MYFLFDFGWYSIHFDIVCYEQGGEGRGWVGVAWRTKSVKCDEIHFSKFPKKTNMGDEDIVFDTLEDFLLYPRNFQASPLLYSKSTKLCYNPQKF